MVKDFTLKTDCLEAVKFIAQHPELLSRKTEEILKEMIAVRKVGDDPIKPMLEYNLKLIEILRELAEKLQPKKSAPS